MGLDAGEAIYDMVTLAERAKERGWVRGILDMPPEQLFSDLFTLISGGDEGTRVVSELWQLVVEGKADELSGVVVGRGNAAADGAVPLSAPIPRPRKNVVCLGRNYAEHARERGAAAPEYPVFFTKPPTAVVGPGADIHYPQGTKQLDYEAELAVVIGREGKNIAPDQAMDYVFGYTVINDITARDIQKRHQQWFKGKGFDTSCPMGPAVVTRNEIPDPHNLAVRAWVNGEVRQDANTGQMIFRIPDILAALSQDMTLEPGDVIATGTPAGVGAGFDPPRFLQPGDVVEVEVAGIGRIRNRVVSLPTL